MNQKIIVYYYELNHGGMGDLFKYLLDTIKLTIENKCKLFIEINHPIKKYIKINDNYKFSDDINQYHYIDNSDRNTNFVDILKKYDKIRIFPSNFYGYEIKFNLSNIPLNIFDYIDFTNDIHYEVNKIIPKYNFISIHIRLGDKYHEIKPSNGLYCSTDDRNVNTIKCEDAIDNIMKLHNETIYLFSDNNSFKQKIKTKFNKIQIFNNRIINTSSIYNINDYDDCLKNTIIEFIFLAKSKKIYGLSPSGFSDMARYIGQYIN